MVGDRGSFSNLLINTSAIKGPIGDPNFLSINAIVKQELNIFLTENGKLLQEGSKESNVPSCTIDVIPNAIHLIFQ